MEPEPGHAPGTVDPEFAEPLKLFTVLSRAHAALHGRAAADIARHGLSPTEFAVLEALYHKGPLLHGEIGQRILVSSGGITYLVDRLEVRNLLERRDCPGDRRARFVALTPGGIELMDRIFPEHARAISEMLSTLSGKQQRRLTKWLRSLGTAAARPSDDSDAADVAAVSSAGQNTPETPIDK